MPEQLQFYQVKFYLEDNPTRRFRKRGKRKIEKATHTEIIAAYDDNHAEMFVQEHLNQIIDTTAWGWFVVRIELRVLMADKPGVVRVSTPNRVDLGVGNDC